MLTLVSKTATLASSEERDSLFSMSTRKKGESCDRVRFRSSQSLEPEMRVVGVWADDMGDVVVD